MTSLKPKESIDFNGIPRSIAFFHENISSIGIKNKEARGNIQNSPILYTTLKVLQYTKKVYVIQHNSP